MIPARRLAASAAILLGGFGALAVTAPRVLAFPYHAVSNGQRVWSETPIDQPALDRITARAAKLVNASPLSNGRETRDIYLTNGGWRWTMLSLQNRAAFGVTRAVNEAVLLNRSDLARDRIFNRSGRERALSGVIAHETCHGMERRRFGFHISLVRPQWLVEGYCDHVAQESTLGDAEAARLKAQGRSSPALPYYEGRRKVAAILAENGGNVDALFAGEP